MADRRIVKREDGKWYSADGLGLVKPGDRIVDDIRPESEWPTIVAVTPGGHFNAVTCTRTANGFPETSPAGSTRFVPHDGETRETEPTGLRPLDMAPVGTPVLLVTDDGDVVKATRFRADHSTAGDRVWFEREDYGTRRVYISGGWDSPRGWFPLPVFARFPMFPDVHWPTPAELR